MVRVLWPIPNQILEQSSKNVYNMCLHELPGIETEKMRKKRVISESVESSIFECIEFKREKNCSIFGHVGICCAS